jgi:hypothetical protein
MGKAVPRIKTELLAEGMVVMTDVKNMDDTLLIPAGCTLTARQIGILQAWGVEEIDVKNSAAIANADPLARLSPETIATLTQEVRARFWQPDETSPLFAELCRLLIQRRTRKLPPSA